MLKVSRDWWRQYISWKSNSSFVYSTRSFLSLLICDTNQLIRNHFFFQNPPFSTSSISSTLVFKLELAITCCGDPETSARNLFTLNFSQLTMQRPQVPQTGGTRHHCLPWGRHGNGAWWLACLGRSPARAVTDTVTTVATRFLSLTLCPVSAQLPWPLHLLPKDRAEPLSGCHFSTMTFSSPLSRSLESQHRGPSVALPLPPLVHPVPSRP